MTKPEGFEFRSANGNEMAQFQLLGSYVFAQPPGEDELPQLLAPEWTHCAFKNQKLAAISGTYPFVVRLNGKTAQLQGVTMVGTEPEFRRRGLVRQLITDLLHRGKGAGDVASILLASKGAIYQRFGYGQASSQVSYEFDPKEASFKLAMEDPGHIERMGHDEALPLITSIYKSYARSRNMLALRGEGSWGAFTTDMKKHKAFCCVHFNQDNQPDGYCIYSTKWDESTGQELAIADFAYTSINAYRSIWNNICAHDLVTKIRWANVPEDDPAQALLLEPRCLNRKTSDGLWLRIIDVAAALAARHYDVDGDLVIGVKDDDVCPWNNAAYHLSARGGVATIETVDFGDADIICDPNALASIISGFSSVSYLYNMGLIESNDTTQLGYHDQLMSTRFRPALSFNF